MMRLFMIKRRSDGLFFVSLNWGYRLHAGPDVKWRHWNDKGRFFRTPDGVVRNLRKLCSEPYWNTTPPPKVCAAVAARWKEVAWRGFDAARLSRYEVVAMDVDILSMTAMPASSFAQVEAIEFAPITKLERIRERENTARPGNR